MSEQIHEWVGLEARGSDGAKVGRVIGCHAGYFTVEKGHIFPRDTFVPYDEVTRIEPEAIVLREAAGFYRAGGDVDDGHWSAEKARRARAIAHKETAHDVGLTPAREDDLDDDDEVTQPGTPPVDVMHFDAPKH